MRLTSTVINVLAPSNKKKQGVEGYASGCTRQTENTPRIRLREKAGQREAWENQERGETTFAQPVALRIIFKAWNRFWELLLITIWCLRVSQYSGIGL